MIDEIAAVVPDSLATMSAMMRVDDQAATPVAPFLAGADFDAMACLFGAACGSADCRPALSLWSLSYFAALIIPSTVGLLCLDRILPVGLDDMALSLDDDGALLGLRVKHAGRVWNETESPGRFDTLRDGHLRPFIARFAARARLPQRLLWSNAGTILDFVVRELIATADVKDTVRREAEALIDDEASPLRAFTCGKRKVCCLRYRLPGLAPCPGVCPVDQAICARPCRARHGMAVGSPKV